MAQFRTRARALDLLGRQQIAGIPTAINELIKNAHDAYADNFKIDFLREFKLLVLSDDGLGMTKDEFESRWLTLGTESKLANGKTSLPPIDDSKPMRSIMGEKGIGRLAIASIGKQVLVISKAKHRSREFNLVAAFINWEVFELPGLNLEDIVIPVREFKETPTIDDLNNLKNEVVYSLEKLKSENYIEVEDFKRIKKTIDSFTIDLSLFPEDIKQRYQSIIEKGGTHFYISSVYETLINDIEGDSNDDEATKMEKMLMGFHNTMTPNHPQPALDIAFKDYRSDDGTFVSIIDKEQFFTPEEFELADHHFQGEFDEYGQFKGLIKIYGEKTYNHIVNWRENHYRQTECGPFKINLAYIQGDVKSSRIDLENYAIIKAKAKKYGGLYIYRDNIRILPYGDSDYDFIDIEKNRTKRISTYFFSYRRMFGAIEITNANNKGLIEKAGREGFIENKAYRQLQSILKNFFIQLAADFFNENGDSPLSQFWKQKKDSFKAYYAALERRDKLSKAKKEKFVKQLDVFFNNLTNQKFDHDLDEFINKFEQGLKSILFMQDADEASQKLIDLESSLRKDVSNYKKQISIPSPRGFTITKSLRADYETYLNEFKILEQTKFKNVYEQIDSFIEEYSKELDLEVSKRKRLEQAVEQISNDALSLNKKKKSETNEVVSNVSRKIKTLTNDLLIDLDNQIRIVKDQFKQLATNYVEDFSLVEERKQMETQIELIRDRNTEIMERIIRQFESFYVEKNEDGQIITNDQIAEATSEELEDLRDRLQSDIELSQLGLAVGILHHEFSGTIKSVRHSLKDLKAWSDVDEKLEGVYKNLKINFEHLDGYLNLFTPLNRRLNRRREDISLVDVKTFLIDLFKSRLERHNIAFKHTKGFATRSIYGFRSTFYPVFVNLVDNAIFWLNQCDIPEKVIRLHADDTGIYISNNGPQIKPQDKERIFALRFSRKPNGRGLGLSISKEVLNAEDYDISLVEARKDSTVTFKILKIQH